MKPRTDSVRVPAERSGGVPLVPCLEFQNRTKPAIPRSDTLMPAVSPTRRKHTQLRITKAPNSVPYREFLALSTTWTMPAGDR